jgi:hypothetical protein
MNNKYHYEVIEGKKKRVYDTPQEKDQAIQENRDILLKSLQEDKEIKVFPNCKEFIKNVEMKVDNEGTKPSEGEQLWEDLKKYYRENPKPKNHLISKLFLSLLIISLGLVLGYYLAYLIGVLVVG